MAEQREDAEIKADEPTLGLDPAGTEPQTTSLHSAPVERVGGTIGPYKLLDELGEGGMGTVYLAEQDRPVRRRVALKIIKAGLDTAQVIARFEAERQALALMDHSNIARVVDAGTTASGRPYFVMELVQGVPITAYCDQRRLPLRQRLELFLPICRAVQHAHQKGIIHRDLKPSNILVTLRDDQPVPKIIDFGIAKATTQRLTERTLYTQYGQLVGTPDYMSPEQAGMGGIDVDTRSDVYSLGAVLYELLCGDTPLGHERIKQLDFMSMLNVIYEHEPPRPSRRVAELVDSAGDIARRRDSDPAKLVQHLRGELDWIAAKALEKERTRRYESPSALAADIERHLNNQPVEASPPSATYRLQKYIRRNRAALAAAAAIVLVLLGGIIASGWQAYRATQAEQEMAVEREAALNAKQLAESRRRDAEIAKDLADERGTQLNEALAQAKIAASKEREARAEIEERLRQADAMRLAMGSGDARQNEPQLALLLAAEAVEATHRRNEPVLPAADQALRDALNAIGGRPLANSARFLEASPGSRWLFGTDVQGRALRWDLHSDEPEKNATVVGPPGLNHAATAISRDGYWLATTSANGNLHTVRLWNAAAGRFDQPVREMQLSGPDVNQLTFSPDARWLIAISAQAASSQTARLWDLSKDGDNPPIIFFANNNSMVKLAISPTGRWAVSSDFRGVPSLWEITSGAFLATPRVMAGDPKHVEISPDGRWMALSARTSKQELRIWIVATDDPLGARREIPLDQQALQGDLFFRFTPDGGNFAVVQRGEIALWDPAAESLGSPRVTLSLPEPPDGVYAARPIHDITGDREGRLLVAARHDGTIFRWDLKAKDPPASRTALGRHPHAEDIQLTISASGRWLVSARQNDHARLWDLWERNPAAVGMPLTGHDAGVAAVAFGGSSGLVLRPSSHSQLLAFPTISERWLVTADRGGTPRLWDLSATDPAHAGLQTGALRFNGSNAEVRPDGKWVIVGPPPNVQMVDPAAENPLASAIRIRTGQPVGVWSSANAPLSADGRWYATPHANEILIWDLASEQFRASQAKNAAGMLPRLGQLFSLDSVSAHKPHKIVRQSYSGVGGFTISPDGNWLLTGGTTSERKLWNLGNPGTHAAPVDLGRGMGQHRPAQFSGDGRWLGVVGTSGILFLSRPVVALWDLSATPPKQVLLNLQEDSGEQAILAFSGDGKCLVVANPGLRIWTLGKEGPAAEPVVLDDLRNTYFRPVAVSRDGRRVAAASNQTIHLWEQTEAAVRHQVLHGHETDIGTLAFSPDDRWLASGAATGDIRLWNVRAAEPQATMIVLKAGRESQSPQGVTRFCFSPDGKWLSGSSFDAVHIWRLDAAGLLDTARRFAARELSGAELDQYRLKVPEVLRGRLLREAAAIAWRLESNPNDLTLRRLRADVLACAGDFPAAIDEMRSVIRLAPTDHWHQYTLLPLLAKANRKEEYLRACQSMADQFADEARIVYIHERVAKGALFWAESGADWTKLAPLAERGLKEATERRHEFLPWFQITKGLAEYRLGKYAAALEWANKGLSGQALVGPYFAVPANQLKAMALGQLGRPDEAQAALAVAKQVHLRLDQPLDRTQFAIQNWHDWYMADMMFREAEAVLLAKTSRDVAAAPSAASAEAIPISAN